MRDQEIVGLWEAYNGIYEQESATGPRLTDAMINPHIAILPNLRRQEKVQK